MIEVQSYSEGRWTNPDDSAREVRSAIDGRPVARVGARLDMAAALDHARRRGGPALRALTFHDRARMLKAIAVRLNERKETLRGLSFDTGATRSDSAIDIEGGIGTLFVYASKGRREMPDSRVYLDGPVERLGRTGAFVGRHIAVPLEGAAVHINAFNFPVWGMLEKLGPTLLAGVPAIVKPATATAQVAEACARMIVESEILPEGAFQFIAGPVGDLLDGLGGQDAVAFTGSAATAAGIRRTPSILSNATRFTAEQDSLNATILGPDVTGEAPEMDIFLDEVAREMTAKAGQKCTAIRRVIVPGARMDEVAERLSRRLADHPPGDPRDGGTRLGALVNLEQRRDVIGKAEIIGAEARLVFGSADGLDPDGAFLPPMLFRCDDPDAAARVHDTEAFGPVSTLMPCRDMEHAAALANRGGGSLVVSLVTHDPGVAREVALATAAHHGRLYINDRSAASEATGHGAPMPHMVHGGPGRAGGGEELGGVRGVMHYMRRAAVQGSPDMLTAIGGRWVPGAEERAGPAHPFTRRFGELEIGETLRTPPRRVTLEDIEHFAEFTRDTFYAHMDGEAAARNPFFPGRVAHGYLLLSFAAGLFVEPNEGPVLANTGLDGLRFLKPVEPGAAIDVRLTVKAKTPRTPEYGEVRWRVAVFDDAGDAVAEYDLLTMVAV